MSPEVLRSSSWVKGPDFLRTKKFPFGPSTKVVKNIKFGIVTTEIDETNASLVGRVDFGVENPIVLDARHAFVKLFPRHPHVKRHHQGIEYPRN